MKRVLNAKISLRDAALLCEALELNDPEWQAIIDAAEDAHLTPRAYCRLMVLAAAGMGGVLEHLERAIGASFDADRRPGIRVRIEAKQKRSAKRVRRG
jgi:hypothetical protein